MTTYNDDLHLVLSWAQTTWPAYDSEVTTGGTYINFAHASAVIIDVEYTTVGKVWGAEALAWDQSGGVNDEHFIGVGTLAHVLREVNKFLAQERDKEEALERLLAEMPEDL